MKPAILLFLIAAIPISAAEPLTYWVAPCDRVQYKCDQSDEELARWAIQAWEKASGGHLRFTSAPLERARLRVYWASGREGLYGEARGIMVEGKPGAEVHVRPTLDGLGPAIVAMGAKDDLFRQTILYLTVLHEVGHALGLPHTSEFPDIMYNFAYGGDILEYFSRYRRKLRTRESIPEVSGLSGEDVRRVGIIYGLRKAE